MKSIEFSKELYIANSYRIAIAQESSYNIIDDGETLELRLSAEIQPIYVRTYVLGQVHDGAALLDMELAQHIERFVADGIVPVLKREVKYAIEPGVVGQVRYQQVVVHVDLYQWWIARIASSIAHPSYYLMHWVGSRSDAENVVSAFSTFTIERPENRVRLCSL